MRARLIGLIAFIALLAGGYLLWHRVVQGGSPGPAVAAPPVGSASALPASAESTAPARAALPTSPASAPPLAALPAEAPTKLVAREVGPDPAQVGPWADGNVAGIYRDGVPAEASVTVAGRTFPGLLANEVGAFPRVYVGAEARAEVTVHYPEATPGETIQAQMIDGGTLGEAPARQLTLDAAGRISFPMITSAHAGKHRVFLNYGGDRKVLNLWVGAPLPVQATLSPL
jgi:hypothetical protein